MGGGGGARHEPPVMWYRSSHTCNQCCSIRLQVLQLKRTSGVFSVLGTLTVVTLLVATTPTLLEIHCVKLTIWVISPNIHQIQPLQLLIQYVTMNQKVMKICWKDLVMITPVMLAHLKLVSNGLFIKMVCWNKLIIYCMLNKHWFTESNKYGQANSFKKFPNFEYYLP